MATSTVGTLTAELEVMKSDLKRMQEEHPGEQFPEDVAERWDRTLVSPSWQEDGRCGSSAAWAGVSAGRARSTRDPSRPG